MKDSKKERKIAMKETEKSPQATFFPSQTTWSSIFIFFSSVSPHPPNTLTGQIFFPRDLEIKKSLLSKYLRNKLGGDIKRGKREIFHHWIIGKDLSGANWIYILDPPYPLFCALSSLSLHLFILLSFSFSVFLFLRTSFYLLLHVFLSRPFSYLAFFPKPQPPPPPNSFSLCVIFDALSVAPPSLAYH